MNRSREAGRIQVDHRSSPPGDEMGHFNVECQARDDAGMGNTLKFSLYFDQTQIPGILAGLNQTIERFPLIGNRDA